MIRCMYRGWVVAALLGVPLVGAAAPPEKIVTAAQVNGTWKSTLTHKDRDGTLMGLDRSFSVLAIGNQKLKVSFDGAKFYKDPGGNPTANSGSASGTAFIAQNVATFKPDGEADCLITMTFDEPLLEVRQEGCEGLFGNGVSAQGSYKRTSRKRPVLEP